MTVYVALLRAINVGGTGSLPMTELVKLCEGAGFTDVKTYIQSGNVVFRSSLSEAKTKETLEKALAKKMGKHYGAMIRTGKELDTILKKIPFKNAESKFVVIHFLDEAPSKADMASITTKGKEVVKQHGRELLIHYVDGQGRSTLKIPFAKNGTARNQNTVQKLADMAREL